MARLLLLEPQAPLVPELFRRPFELLHSALCRLLELQDGLVDGEALARSGVDLGHPAVAPGAQHVLHLHGFDHRQFLARSEEHTSELQSLMRISYAVFCLKKKKNKN